MSITDKQFNDFISEFAKQDLEQALILITANFVGLNEAYIALNKEGSKKESKKEIVIKGGYRDITIHAKNGKKLKPAYVISEKVCPMLKDGYILSIHFENEAAWVTVSTNEIENILPNELFADEHDLDNHIKLAIEFANNRFGKK